MVFDSVGLTSKKEQGQKCIGEGPSILNRWKYTSVYYQAKAIDTCSRFPIKKTIISDSQAAIKDTEFIHHRIGCKLVWGPDPDQYYCLET